MMLFVVQPDHTSPSLFCLKESPRFTYVFCKKDDYYVIFCPGRSYITLTPPFQPAPSLQETDRDRLSGGEDFFLQNTTNIAVAVRGTLCGPQDGNAINLYLLSLVRPNFSWTENVHLDIGQI